MKEWNDIICKDCGCEVKAEDRIKSPPILKCRECYRSYIRERTSRLSTEQRYYGNKLPVYGKTNVKEKPGDWFNEDQKKYVSDILYSIGWKHNKEKNIWYDNKIKDQDGNWLVDLIPDGPKVFRREYKNSNTKYRRIVGDDPNKIPTISYTIKSKEVFTPEQIRDIQIKYFINNRSTGHLSDEYGVPTKNIMWVVLTTYKKFKIAYGE